MHIAGASPPLLLLLLLWGSLLLCYETTAMDSNTEMEKEILQRGVADVLKSLYDTKFWISEAVKSLWIPQLLLAGAPLTPVLGQGKLYGEKESFSVQVNFLSLFPASFLAPFPPPLHMQLSPKVHAVRGIPWSRIATKCKQIEMPRKQKWSRFVAVEKVDHKKKAKKKSCQHVWNPPFSPADSF